MADCCKPFNASGQHRLSPWGRGQDKGPGQADAAGRCPQEPGSEPRKLPFPLTFSTNRRPWGCPWRPEPACRERGLGHRQRGPLLAVDTALSTLPWWRDAVGTTPAPNFSSGEADRFQLVGDLQLRDLGLGCRGGFLPP